MQSYSVLCCLADCGRLSQKDIAARTGIDPSDLLPLLDALKEEIRVFCEKDDADCRRDDVRISLGAERGLAGTTAAGRQGASDFEQQPEADAAGEADQERERDQKTEQANAAAD